MYMQTTLAVKICTFFSVLVLLVMPANPVATVAKYKVMRTNQSLSSSPVLSGAKNYGQLPLSFEPNAGQSEAAVRFQAHVMGGMLFFEEDAVALSFSTTGSHEHKDPTDSVVHLFFDGVDDMHRVVSAERLPGIVNYFIGNDPARWFINLPTYSGIDYQQLYPGIDLHYDGAQSFLKGTYTLAAHADTSQIRWHYEGVKSLRVDDQTGDLILMLGDASMLIEKAPSAWQSIGGMQVSVSVRYELMQDDSIGFALGSYDANEPLTIDPQLIYSTFLGGNAFDEAKSVAVDFAGNAYLTGFTQSTNFPTQNSISNTLNGSTDAFVMKINETGTALIYATYLGGSNDEDAFGSERAGGIAVDSNGYAYVTGCTNSANFPTLNAFQPTHGANTSCDVFVSKLNQAGNGLIYSSFLGGPGADSANAIAVDDEGSAYLAGDAGKDFPGNPFVSSTHVFVVKINPGGSAVVFSRFLGGNSYEFATDIAVDSAHNIYVVGNTFSTDFPVLNPAQPTIGGGTSSHHDAFVTKIKADNSGLLYSTYLGGNNTDEAAGIAVDDLGSAYVTGVTQSNLDFPIVNAYQASYGGGRSDIFVTKLNPAGNEFVFSTFLGGNNDENFDSGHGPYGAIVVDSKYNASVTGYTCSTNFPTLGSFQKAKSGSCYAIITRFNPSGKSLLFSTLIGSQGGGPNALGTDIALDFRGDINVVGETNATDLLTMNPLQPTRSGSMDAFILKIDMQTRLFLPLISKAPLQIQTLQISSPNGSEQWQPGTTHAITWTQSGLSGDVTIQLYQDASLSSQVGTASAAAGSFTWAITAGQATGHNYQIRIFQGAVEDYSDANFNIVAIRKYDLLGSWSTGVSSLNSDTGTWNLITSSVATQIAAGDMDGDGKADIICDFLASGLWEKYSATDQWQFISSSPSGIAVGDFNGDGKADLAGIWSSVIWIRDSATGSWTAGPSGASQIAAGDFNSDGKADLVANYPTTGVWMQYSASGAWSNLTPDPATRIAVGDFNGDSKADLAGIWNNLIWIRDSATGSWAAGPADTTLITTGDLNGDGKADLVVNYPTTGVWVQYSATGAWSNLTTSPATWIATGLIR